MRKQTENSPGSIVGRVAPTSRTDDGDTQQRYCRNWWPVNAKRSDTIGPAENCQNAILFALDSILALFVIPINGIIFWSTVEFTTTKLVHLNTVTVFAIAFIHISMHLASNTIYRFIRNRINADSILFYIVSRIYIYLFALCGVIVYVGFLEPRVSNIPSGDDPVVNGLAAVISIALLFVLRCYPHLAGFTSADIGEETTPEDVFLFPCRLFHFSWKKNKFLYIFDSVFSVFLISILALMAWRGSWCLLDMVVFPHDDLISGFMSLIIGYSTSFVCYSFQIIIKRLISKYDDWRRRTIFNVFVLVAFFGAMNIWRGVWVVLENYANLGSTFNCLTLHFSSFFILVAFHSSKSLLLRGVYVDKAGEDWFKYPHYFSTRSQKIYDLEDTTKCKLNIQEDVEQSQITSKTEHEDEVATKIDSHIRQNENASDEDKTAINDDRFRDDKT